MMKNLFTLFYLMAIASVPGYGQVVFSAKLGVSPGQYPAQAGLFVNRQDPLNEFYFNLVHLKQQRYAGLGVSIPLNAYFFLETGLTYTRQETQYMAQYTYNIEIRASQTQVINESVDQLFLPVDIGVVLGPVDITSGLKINRSLKSSHEFTFLEGFSEDKSMIHVGWQMGIRAGIRQLKAGIEFHGTLHRTCEDRFIHGQSLAIRHIPGRLTFNLQFRM